MVRGATVPPCTRRTFGPTAYLCPGAFGYCDGCPHVPRIAPCKACGVTVQVLGIEHANRVTGGFGCGLDGCPPPKRSGVM